MRNHSKAGSRTHSRQNSQSAVAAASSSVTSPDPVPVAGLLEVPAQLATSNGAAAQSPPPYHHEKGSLPPQLSKWVELLQDSFADDLHQLQHDLDAAHRQALDALASSHAAQLADMESKLAAAQDALARAQPAIKYRPLAHRLLVDMFQAKQQAKTCSSLFLLWRQRASCALHERHKVAAADRHAHKALVRKAFNGWFQAVRDVWRQEREKRLDAMTKQAVAQATHSLESRLRDLARELQDERRRRDELIRQQRAHEAEMRAAFVRGLSALNMETMAVLQPMMAQTMKAPEPEDDHESIIIVQAEEGAFVSAGREWSSDSGSAAAAAPSTGAAGVGQSFLEDNPTDPLRLSLLSTSYRASSPIPSSMARASSSPHSRRQDRASSRSLSNRPPSAAAAHAAPVAALAGKRSQGGSTSASRRSSFSFRPPGEDTAGAAGSKSRLKVPDPVRLMQGKKHHSSTSSIKSLREPVYVERHARPDEPGQSAAVAGKGHTERFGPGMATGFFSPS